MKNKTLNSILLIYLIIQPFLDVIATTSFKYVNIIIRGLFLIFTVIYLIKNKLNLKLLIFIALIAIILAIYYYLNDTSIYQIISSIMKLLFLPITLLFFYNISIELENKHLIIPLITYISLFIISYIFGFGYENYEIEVGKHGFRGIFNSINEISAIIIGLIPIALNYLKENKKIILSVLLIISTLIVSLLTGTKVLMLGLILIVLITYIKDIINLHKKLDKNKKILSIILTIILLMIGIYLITKTRFFNNMIVQANFFNVKNIFSLEFLNIVIFNDRLTFLYNNYIHYINQGILTNLFGIGYFNEIIKFVEIDIFDILFRYGTLGLILFIVPIIYVFKNIKINKIGLFSIIFLILISLTSGHVLINPNVAIYFGYIIAINKRS